MSSSDFYHQQYAGQVAPEQIIVQSKAQQPYQGNKTTWSWCSTGWSIFSIFCCSPFILCGLLGLVFSLTSYTDHKMGDWGRSKSKKSCAWGCTITAIVLGLLIILGILLIFFVSPWGAYLTSPATWSQWQN